MAADEFFIYKFSREQAGLSGLAFDEGQFGVFGYVTAVRALAQACAMRLKVHSLKQSVFENVCLLHILSHHSAVVAWVALRIRAHAPIMRCRCLLCADSMTLHSHYSLH